MNKEKLREEFEKETGYKFVCGEYYLLEKGLHDITHGIKINKEKYYKAYSEWLENRADTDIDTINKVWDRLEGYMNNWKCEPFMTMDEINAEIKKLKEETNEVK